MEILDKAKYHADGDFPRELPREQAYLIGGMFIAWAAAEGLLSESASVDFAEERNAVLARAKSPCSLYRAVGGVFTTAHLNQIGADFARAYFDFDTGAYLDDYIETLATELPTAYHVADSWRNFDKIAAVISRRYRDWMRR